MRVVVNAALRLSIIYFLAEVMAKPDDPRFAGKAIPVRNLIVADVGRIGDDEIESPEGTRSADRFEAISMAKTYAIA